MSAVPSLGGYLRRSRERAGLSVEAVSAGSRIAARLVHAREADQHAHLPAPVYVRGFIRAYCEEVGADAERAIRLYDAQAVPDPPLTVRPVPAAQTVPAGRPWRRVVAGSLVVAALVAAAVLLLARRQPDAIAGRGGVAPATVSPPVAPVAAVPPAATTSTAPPAPPDAPPAAAPPPSASPAPPPSPTPPPSVERVLLIRAVDTTWVRVVPDGGQPAEETLSPGAVRQWRGASAFRVTIGNAGGVLLELDGRALPALGERGQVVHRTIPDERRP